MFGFLDSSVKYNSRREGIAKKIKIIAGKIVQTVSIYWASSKYRFVNLLSVRVNIAYPTTVITKVKMISV